MKQLLTYLFLLFSSFNFAQNIPNGDFENWEVRDHFKLSGWYSYTSNVERTSDAKEGEYAIKLSNSVSNNRRGLARTLDYANKSEINGLAANADALSIAFWCKYDLAIGDTARMYTVLREEGVYRGKVDFRFTGSSNSKYVKFSVPIEWNTSGSRQFDSAWFYLYSYVENAVDGDGYVIFDDIHFENIGERTGASFNCNFENWYNQGVDFPSSWRTLDLLTFDTYTSFLNTKSCVFVPSENTKLGNISLQIQNYLSGESVRRGYAYIGEENNDYYTPHFQFTDTFKYLQGYYKYLPDGPDTARVNFRTYANGGQRSSNNLYLHEEKTEWTFFSMPLTYNDTYNPDSAALIFYSGNDDNDEYGINTRLIIDNLELVMEPEPLKLGVPKLANRYTYYPNPTGGKVQVDLQSNITNAVATNTLGQEFAIDFSSSDINLSMLNNGLYFVTITIESGQQAILKIYKQNIK